MSDDSVILRFPASTERVRLARALVATLADEAGFDYDDVQDLRIAVDELCFMLLDSGAPVGMLELTARQQKGMLEVAGTCQFDGIPHEAADDPSTQLTRQILATVIDEYEFRFEGTTGHFFLRKSKL